MSLHVAAILILVCTVAASYVQCSSWLVLLKDFLMAEFEFVQVNDDKLKVVEIAGVLGC